MKKYKPLVVPKTSAWSKPTWRKYTPIWFNRFVESLTNTIKWLPTIWADRHWDDYYITNILQRKIELQREYLVKANRHTNIEHDNKWMTVVLNLLEREHNTFYEGELTEYHNIDMEVDDNGRCNFVTNWEMYDEYLAKYPTTLRRVLKKYPEYAGNKDRLSMIVSMHQQKKCRNLLFEILKQKSANWWD
jgi:hypothetical protein